MTKISSYLISSPSLSPSPSQSACRWLAACALVLGGTGLQSAHADNSGISVKASEINGQLNTQFNTQLQAIANSIHTGRISCELGAFVEVVADAKQPGFFDLKGKGFTYHMAPVVSSTGAIRLEDPKAGALWIQLGHKSMLLNQKLGQRIADECVSPQQALVAQAMRSGPPSRLLD